MRRMDDSKQADAERIASLGGPAKVAELLGYDKADGGVQRVHNWVTRGIPSRVKLDRPDLFLRPTVGVADSNFQAATQQASNAA